MENEVQPINANDLALFVQIIDVVSQRGAIKGEEMEAVGSLRTKLVAYLNSIAPPPEEAPAEEEEAAE